jgi:hypothetical protein
MTYLKVLPRQSSEQNEQNAQPNRNLIQPLPEYKSCYSACSVAYIPKTVITISMSN